MAMLGEALISALFFKVHNYIPLSFHQTPSSSHLLRRVVEDVHGGVEVILLELARLVHGEVDALTAGGEDVVLQGRGPARRRSCWQRVDPTGYCILE